MGKYKKYFNIYSALGITNLALFLETLLSKKKENYSFFSIHTSKEINLIIFLILALILIYGGIKYKSN